MQILLPLRKNIARAILDEVQAVPDVFRQLQGMPDKTPGEGSLFKPDSIIFYCSSQLANRLQGVQVI